MAVCKAASRRCNEEHLWITSFFVKLQIPSLQLKKSTPLQIFLKDF